MIFWTILFLGALLATAMIAHHEGKAQGWSKGYLEGSKSFHDRLRESWNTPTKGQP